MATKAGRILFSLIMVVAIACSLLFVQGYHFQEWTISGNCATVRVILLNGTVADTYQLWT